MKRNSKIMIAIFLIVMLSLCGCASVARFANDDERKEVKAGIYFATQMDIGVIKGAFNSSESNWFQGVAIVMLPFAIIDIPFSIVTDTIMLPFDLYKVSGYEEDIEFWTKFSKNKSNILPMSEYLDHTGVAGIYIILEDTKNTNNENHLKLYFDIARKSNGKKGSSEIIRIFVRRAKDNIHLKDYLCEAVISDLKNSERNNLYGITKNGYHTKECILKLAEQGIGCKFILSSRLLPAGYFRRCYIQDKIAYQSLLTKNSSTPNDIHEEIYKTVYEGALKKYRSLKHTPQIKRESIDSLARFTKSEQLIERMFVENDASLNRNLLLNPSVTEKIKIHLNRNKGK